MINIATLKAAIALYDGATGPLKSITNAMNIAINTFESMQIASSSAVDTSAFQSAREELAKAEVGLNAIEANIMKVDAAQQRLNQDINGTEGYIRDNINGQDSFNRLINQGAGKADALMQKIKGAAAAYISLQGLQNIIGLADNMTNTTARLSLIVDDGGSVAELQERIMASAQRSRAAYQTTADTITKLGMQAGDAFSNTDELIAFTEQLNKSFVIAGTDATGIDSTMYNLTQALASGVLKGQDLNAVMSNAMPIVQNIADYLEVPVGTIKEMAAQGEISAAVVKNAMLAAAEETNAVFEQMPMTWAQVWTSVQNMLLQTFEPLIQAIGHGAQFIYDNWSTLEPIFIGLAAAIAIYTAATLAKAAADWLAVAANQALIASMLSNPWLWIAVAIGAVVGVIYKFIQSVGGLQNAWELAKQAMTVAVYALQFAFFTALYGIMNVCDSLGLAWETLKVNIGNTVGNMKADVLMKLENLANGAIDIINSMMAAINSILPTSFEAIQHVTFGTEAVLENDAAKAAREAQLSDYAAQLEVDKNARQAQLEALYNNVVDARDNLTSMYDGFITGAGAAAADPLEDIMNSLNTDGLYSNVADTTANTSAISNQLDYAKEDLEYLRDIAERDAINRFTTAEVKIDMTGMNNRIEGSADLDGLISALTDEFTDALVVASEGVHL